MQSTDLKIRNRKIGFIVLAVVVLMVGLSFAAVPMYRLFCQITGFGGTTQRAEALPEQVLERSVKIHFNADTGKGFMWDFKPEQREVTVKLGQRGLTAFHAKNRANAVTSGTALYNVTPLKAGKYFHKIQCFCFDEQSLQPNEEVSMPVVFYIDPAMNDDPNLDDVKVITLSYTFYPAESKMLDDALEAFYDRSE